MMRSLILLLVLSLTVSLLGPLGPGGAAAAVPSETMQAMSGCDDCVDAPVTECQFTCLAPCAAGGLMALASRPMVLVESEQARGLLFGVDRPLLSGSSAPPEPSPPKLSL